MEKLFINPGREQWPAMIKRPAFDYASLENIVLPILQDVKINGDGAVKKYTENFDGVQLTDLKVTDLEINNAVSAVDEELKKAIQFAKENITTFHAAQTEQVSSHVSSRLPF